MTTLTGLVLAGGGSSRMGQDKATLVVDGERLVDRAVRRIADGCVEVLVAPGSRRSLDVPGASVIPDAAGEGPLAGIVSGLHHAGSDLVAVVAVDMPMISSAVLQALAVAWAGEQAVVPVVEGRPQSLHAVYARSSADPLARLLAAGERSVARALGQVEVRHAGRDVWGDVDAAGAFALNLNTEQDVAAFASRSTGPSA